MEMNIGFEQKNLIIIELKQGQELANQLKQQLHSPERSGETCDFLLTTILNSNEKVISMLNSSAFKLEDDDGMLNSTQFLTGDTSPTSEISDEPHKNVFQKRKAMAQWSEQVEVPLETGVEGLLGDGYSWRKYGQKNIFGANFPRAYYRCTHRHSQGCLATKQVQRSDESLSLLQVNYKGRHTCKRGSELSAGSDESLSLLQVNYKGRQTCKRGSELSAGSASSGNEDKRQKLQQQNVEKTISFGTCHKTEEQGKSIEVERLPSFSFPSTIVKSEYKKNHFCSGDTRENSFIDGRYLPSFINQETSECSNLSASPYQNIDNFEIGQNLLSSESGFTEILSAPNSITNSPIGDFDISLDPVDFDPSFPLDVLEFFN